MVSPKIFFPILLYVAWVLAALVPASQLGLWDPDLWKVTILWLLLSGFGLVLNLNDAIQKPRFFRQVFNRAVGLSAIVEFFATLESFPLWLEIPAQALAVRFAGVEVLAARDAKNAAERKIANGYLGLFGLSVLGWALWQVIRGWSDVDLGAIVREFLVPVWLTPIALIFIYGFAVAAAYKTGFKRMRFSKKEGRLVKQRLAILLRSGGRLRTLRLLSGQGAQSVARTSGFRAAWNEVGQIRRDERERLGAKAAAEQRLVDNAGLAGVDESGQQLDRREFEATQKSLHWLASCHMGHYRNGETRYREELLPLIESGFKRFGLISPHGVIDHMTADGRKWYAERRTITGHWFAIGAASPPPDQWLYDGPEKPSSFPSEPEWDQWGRGETAVNWH